MAGASAVPQGPVTDGEDRRTRRRTVRPTAPQGGGPHDAQNPPVPAGILVGHAALVHLCSAHILHTCSMNLLRRAIRRIELKEDGLFAVGSFTNLRGGEHPVSAEC